MSRYSPTVLPEPLYLGDILREGLSGFLGARQQKEERRRVKRQEGIEDRQNRYLEDFARERDLAQPGARTLGAHFADPNAIPLTQETLRTVGRADTDRVPLEFERPAPQSLADFIPSYAPGTSPPIPLIPGHDPNIERNPEPIPGHDPNVERKPSEYMFQGRAPHLTASGIVMDPQAARSEQTLGTVLDAQLKQRLTGPQPWKPTTREEQIDFTRDTAAAGRPPVTPRNIDPLSPEGIRASGQRATATRAPTEPEPPKSIGLLDRQIADTQRRLDFAYTTNPVPEPERDGKVDPLKQKIFDEGERRSRLLEARMDSLVTVRDRVSRDFQVREGVVPERPTTPAAAESAGLFTRLQGALPPRVADVIRAGEQAPMARDVTTVPAATPPDSVSAPAETPPASEIPAPAVSTDLTLAQRQDMAMKEWEKLVDAGTDPDEATRILREKYGLPGGQ